MGFLFNTGIIKIKQINTIRSGRANNMNLFTNDEMGLFSYHVDAGGVCILRLHDKLSPELITQIADCLQHHIAQNSPLPLGIIVDVQDQPGLSAVRLASLLDVLAQLHRPVAVLFAEEKQQQTASLLHNTLRRKELFAYFTDARAAQVHVTTRHHC